MAGNVTGNIGNNDVLLKNMATEETLDQILDTLQKVTITKDPNRSANNAALGANTNQQKKNTETIKGGGKEFEKFIEAFGSGTTRVIRNLDSNINNASYTFQAFSRGNGKMAKAFEFAANSVTQLQDQFNAYGKMMQVGGALTDDFETLREKSVGLGTDLAGLTRFTGEYAQSLKSGAGSVRSGLTSLSDTFKKTIQNDDLLLGWGRLGVGVNQISEQILLASEAQGGYNAVLERYGKSPEAMGKGMLKSTQELNVFASAIGMNSRMMQEEAAKAAQKIQNKTFLATLNAAEQQQLQAIQGLTGNAETAISVMRSIKTGYTDEAAATFLSTQNIAGFGKEIGNLMGLLKEGKGFPEALEKSGLLDKANGISREQLSKLGTDMQAYSSSMPEVAQNMGGLISFINNLKGLDAEGLKKYVADLNTKFDPNQPKTVDSFQLLLREQNTLAFSTAKLNAQINRLGLSLATGAMKATNVGVGAMGTGKEAVIKWLNTYLEGSGLTIPNEILDASNDKIEALVQEWLMGQDVTKKPANKPSGSGVVTLRPEPITNKSNVPVKMANGRIAPINAEDLINNKNNIWAQTNAMGGKNNLAGTVATGAMLTTKIPTLSAITGASDKHHDDALDKNGKPINSMHKQGLALDFGVNDVAGKSQEEVYAETVNTIKKVLKDDYGLGEDEVKVINELKRPSGDAGKHWSGPHIHMEFKKKETSDRMRDIIQKQMSATKVSQNNINEKEVPGSNGTVTQLASNGANVVAGEAPSAVNNSNNNELVALLTEQNRLLKEANEINKQGYRDVAESVEQA